MNRLTKGSEKHNGKFVSYIANVSLYPKMMGYEYVQADMDCINKLGQLEDFEEELGIDFITLFKAIKTKIYAKAHHYKTGKTSILDFEEPRLIKHEEWCLVGTCGTFTYCVALKDYGKTWALTKEELKDDK